jgi:L-iditol 2-dehydrogenase
MRAAVYYRNNDVRLEEKPKPQIGAGELLVKVMACGICGTDVLEWYRVKKAPIVLGHEMAGVIAEAGEGVKNYKAGDRVFVTHHVPCNTCRYCLAGNHTVCETLHTTNFSNGAFAEYIVIPRINVDRGTFILPNEMTFDEGTFIEPLGCVVRGQRTAHFRPGQTLLVMGSGISGLLHILLAKASGAGRIIATDVNDFKLGLAKEFGADVVINAKEDVPKLVKERNENRGADLVMVCTGAFVAFQQALKCVDRAGTLVTFATTEPGVDLPVPINEFWRNSVTVMSSYAAAPYDLATAMELIRAKRVDVNRMITHHYGLADTGKGFKMMTSTTERALKVIIEPQK